MDSLSTQKVKTRKTKVGVKKKSRVQILYNIFCRALEITVVMVTVAKLCYQLIIMLEDSGLTRFLLNRHLAFVLGNAIVITIVTKCRLFVNQESHAMTNINDFYDEFVKKSNSRGGEQQSLQTYAICREKQSMLENRTKRTTGEKRDIAVKSYERSRSEILESSKKRSDTERPADRIDSDNDDELRYKIESFIARQRRNQKDEDF